MSTIKSFLLSAPKSFSEFEKYRQDLFSQEFEGKNLHPIALGLERTGYEITRLQQLILVAQQVESITVKKRMGGWERQLKRTESAHDRFAALAKNIL